RIFRMIDAADQRVWPPLHLKIIEDSSLLEENRAAVLRLKSLVNFIGSSLFADGLLPQPSSY
ncbi:MAG: hypothetical protein AAGA30_21040, partial [Planctomycetota bacterium]